MKRQWWMYVLFILVVTGSIQSCKTVCSEFPTTFRLFEETEIGDRLTFRNVEGENLTFDVEYVYFPDQTERISVLYFDSYCEFQGEYQTDKQLAYQIREEYQSGHFINLWKICLSENDCFEYSIGSNYSEDSIWIVNDTIINNSIYSDLVVLRKDTLENEESVSQILHSHKLGLIAFLDAGRNAHYSRID